MVSLTLVILVQPGELCKRLTNMTAKPSQHFITLLPPKQTCRVMMAQNRAVTTCRLPLQTVGKGDIQQHLTNPNTMPTLISDTQVSRAEPTPFKWTDIILEQKFEY